MANPFDQFDTAAPTAVAAPPVQGEANPFDRFGPTPATPAAAPVAPAASVAPNPFDQFTPPAAPAQPAAAAPADSNPFDQYDTAAARAAAAGHATLQRQWASAGALEKLGMLWKHFSYQKSVEQSFQPSAGTPQLPTVDASTGGAAARVGKELYNTAAGAVNGVLSPGAMSMLKNPLAAAYAVPYFAKQAITTAPKAFASYFDPAATAEDRTKLTASTILDVLGAAGGAHQAIEGVPAALSIADRWIPGLQKYRTIAANKWRAGDVTDAIAYTRDVADTQAERAANVISNDIRGPIQRTFRGDAGKAENALTFMVESLNDPQGLADAKQKITASVQGYQPFAIPKSVTTALEAIDFAQKNFQRLKPMAEAYGDTMKKQWESEQAAGQDTPFRAGYVMHVQDLADPAGFESLSPGGDGVGASFKKERTYDTLADSIAAGIDPKSMNAVDLMRTRITTGQKMINRTAWADSLKDLVDPTTKQPIVTAPTIKTRVDGTTYTEMPRGYVSETLGDKQVAVHQAYKGIIDAMTKPSSFASGTFVPLLQKINATGKSVNLLFDTFHLGRIAMWESAIKAAGMKTFKAPIPSYGKGLTLMDHSVPEIVAKVAAGDVPQSMLPKLLENKQNLDLLVQHGLNTGRVADAMHQEWVRNIPGIGTFNKFVFEKFQRGAMGEIGLLEYERQRGMYPELTDAQVARNVAKDVNTRFGNFGRQGWVKDQTKQDIARLLVLAPQWNEGLLKSEAGGLAQSGSAIRDAVLNRRLASGMLARGTATMLLGQFAANQLINYYTRGHPTWQNPEEGFGAKLSAWVPDKIGGGPGFFLNPMALSAEVSHLFSQRLEKDPDFGKALTMYARSRSSALIRGPATGILRTDATGRPIKYENLLNESFKAEIPIPIASGAAASGLKEVLTHQPSEEFPGQYQKQLMASVGLKADNAPSSEQRIARLAKEYNDRAVKLPAAPQYYASDFQPFTAALRIGNRDDTHSALSDLLEKKTPQQIAQHLVKQAAFPFTGSQAREAQFIRTLNPEEKTTYRKARADREQLGRNGVQFLAKYLKDQRAPTLP